jgi:hypothetical protein
MSLTHHWVPIGQLKLGLLRGRERRVSRLVFNVSGGRVGPGGEPVAPSLHGDFQAFDVA